MANVKVDVGLGTKTQAVEVGGEGPFRIAILGDFSGRANREVTGPLRAVEIDPENFEDVMKGMNVALDLPGGVLEFRELDDFHPDSLYGKAALFAPVREAKAQLARPDALSSAAPPAPPPMPRPGGSLLDQIAQQAAPPQPQRADVRDEKAWDQAIRNIANKHAQAAADPRREQALALIEQTAAAQMRALLSHPDFQAIEAAWRSVFFLFRYVEAGTGLHVHLIDVSQAELLKKIPELSKLLGALRSSVLVGLYTFSPSLADCELLLHLGGMASTLGAPLLGGMDARLFGCESIARSPDPDDWRSPLAVEHQQAWQSLRQSEDASWIGLAFPRFLLRLPYGKKTSPVETLEFEEMPAPSHDGYLWGNPAIACGCLLGREFNSEGWEMRARSMARLDGVPLHTWPDRDATPPAEIWMTERFAGAIAEAGIMPLASIKHSDAVMLVRFQSIADPPQPLAGPW